MTNFHDNKDWNVSNEPKSIALNFLYDQLPWQQGLKRMLIVSLMGLLISLWPTSMTTRIETSRGNRAIISRYRLYDQLPWQQGLKHLQSKYLVPSTILYDQLPWQQGLKHKYLSYVPENKINFMTNFHDNKDWNYSGMRLTTQFIMFFMTNFHDNKDWNNSLMFILFYSWYLYDQLPWQQGLKLIILFLSLPTPNSLWPTSMTTRIETAQPYLI